MAIKFSRDTPGVTGFRKIDKILTRYEKSLQRKWLRKATRESVKHVRAEAELDAPVDSGDLSESLKVRAIKRTRTKIGHQVQTSEDNTVFSGDQYYGQFVEFGTKLRNRKSRTGSGASGFIKAGAFSFLRSALYNNAGRVRQIFVASILASIREARSKAGSFGRKK